MVLGFMVVGESEEALDLQKFYLILFISVQVVDFPAEE